MTVVEVVLDFRQLYIIERDALQIAKFVDFVLGDDHQYQNFFLVYFA